MKFVAGSTATVTVLTVDNSSMLNNPNGTPIPIPVQVVTITLYTPSGAIPISQAVMTPSTTVGYYTYQYQSQPTDEVGQWFASFVALNNGVTGIARKQPVFDLLPAGAAASGQSTIVPATSGVLSVTAGALSAMVSFGGSFNYTVIIATPNWNTTVSYSNQSSTGFTLNFGTQCPVGGGQVTWMVV